MTEDRKRLAQIIDNARFSVNVQDMILRQVVPTLVYMGMDLHRATQWLKEWLNPRVSSFSEWEKSMRRSLEGEVNMNQLPRWMDERAEAWVDKIVTNIGGHQISQSIVDYAGGSGQVAVRLAKAGRSVTVADVLDWRMDKSVDFLQVNGNQTNASDGQFEDGWSLTGGHHSNDSGAYMRELFRICRRRVVIIESVVENDVMMAYGAWVDWFYNNVIHFSDEEKEKIPVPCNFLSVQGWRDLIWKITGRYPTVSKPLGIFQWLNPEWHHLFVYDL